MQQTFQIKVTLSDTIPAIYRRVIVLGDTTFFELHHIIQIAMGWQNLHLFEFRFNDYIIGIPTEAFEDAALGEETVIDADTITLGEVLTDVNETMIYTYDFGDNWEHEVTLEKINDDTPDINLPSCIDGNLSCPPENCGGVPGFVHLFNVIKNEQHPEREQMLMWLEENYTQPGFDIDDINANLADLEQYINNWLNNIDEDMDEDDN